MMAEQGPLSGRVLGDKYRLDALLGEGGFGAVYSARHLLLNRPQAIKVLLERHVRKPKFRERFLREAQTLATLDHPNIVHIDDFVIEEQEAQAYLVMPFIPGGTFHDLLRDSQQSFTSNQVTHYLEQICKALDYAHQHNIVHLDLKPQNLLVHTDGRLLLSDFGLAHLVKQETLEGGSSLSYGTPHYQAPEHWKGKPEKCSDIYALGIILYEILTGEKPFKGSTPEALMLQHLMNQPATLRSTRPDLPEELEEVIQRALAKTASQRYSSAGDLLTAFREALERQHQGIRNAEEERLRREEQLRRAQLEAAHQQELEQARKEAEEQARLRWEEEHLRREEQLRRAQLEAAHQQELEQARKEAEEQEAKAKLEEARLNRNGRRNVLLLVLPLALVVFLIFSVVFASAHGGIRNFLTPSITAQVTITPASKLEQNSYLLQGLTTGEPDPARNEVQARILTTNPFTQKATRQATGLIPATKAKGTLTFLNTGTTPVQINGGVLTGNDGVEISFGPVFVPATSPSSATTIGTAVNAGASGNIPALDISGTCCNNSNITVKNDAFTGGQDPIPVITSDDITKVNNAAKQEILSLTNDTQNSLRQQVKSNEHVVDHTPSCQHASTPDHQAGDQASQVTVTVTVTCTEEVYDYQEALQIIRANLSNTAKSDLGTNYAQYQLDRQIAVSSPSTTAVAKNGQITIQTQAMGLWVYQFTSQMQSNIKQALLKLPEQGAQSYLQHYMGVASATIKLSSGNTMPTNVDDIMLTIQMPSPQAMSTAGPQYTSSSSTPMSTLSGPGMPTPTSTPDQSGA